MPEKSMGLLFFLKKPKNYRNGGLRDVRLKITVDGIARELSCKRKWKPRRWNPHAGRALGLKEDAKELNACLDTLQTLAYDSEGCVPTFTHHPGARVPLVPPHSNHNIV